MGQGRSRTLRRTGPVQWHSVEHRIDVLPFVQILDARVPQGRDQLVEAFRHLDLPIPEQVVDVPKTSSSSRHSRRRQVLLVQQTAEQLVDVPAIVSFSSLRGLVEHNVDIPVPHGRVGRGGGEVLKAFAQDRFPLLHPLTHLVMRMRIFLRFSALFYRRWVRTQGSELGVDFNPWTPAAHLAHVVLGPGMWRDEAGAEWFQMASGRWYLLTNPAGTGMSLGDEVLGIDMGCGCFFLVAGRRAWYCRVRLSGPPSYSEASRAAAGFQAV